MPGAGFFKPLTSNIELPTVGWHYRFDSKSNATVHFIGFALPQRRFGKVL
jgi:hypothetical protein